MALLSIRNVTRRFGGIVAIDDVSLDVEAGQIVGLIGPNGAGKTTLFNVITRLYRPDTGELELDGKSLLRTPPHRIVRRGIARTFQNVELFRTMTVLDNVLVGAHTRTKPFRGSAVARPRARGPRLRRHRGRRAPAGGRPAVRDAEARRARARARRRAAAAAARRAGRRPEPRGGRRARHVHPQAARRLRPDGAARRAPHGARDGHRRAHPRARLRPQDRRGHARRGAARTRR